jgi:uncharacterized protein (DUF1697 family)
MKYAALLRGINVGNSKRIEMKALKAAFESLEYKNVSTYINSGNVIFESGCSDVNLLTKKIEEVILCRFEQNVRTLVKNKNEIVKIAGAIPLAWKNDDTQKTDVAYLFKENDNEGIIELLPVKKEFVRFVYVKGALIWNVSREDYNKSNLNKIIANKIYKDMTVRNVNTARYLAENM